MQLISRHYYIRGQKDSVFRVLQNCVQPICVSPYVLLDPIHYFVCIWGGRLCLFIMLDRINRNKAAILKFHMTSVQQFSKLSIVIFINGTNLKQFFRHENQLFFLYGNVPVYVGIKE